MRSEIILICLAMTAVTFLCRALLTVSVSRIRISPRWEHYLTFILFAVLTALVTPYILMPGPQNRFSLLNPWILAGAITFFLSYRTRNLIVSVGGGIAVFWILGGIM